MAAMLLSMIFAGISQWSIAEDIKTTELYHRIKSSIDAVPAIDTHDHLQAFPNISGRVETPEGRGMTLQSLWSRSYLAPLV